jgi:hypothetical protein
MQTNSLHKETGGVLLERTQFRFLTTEEKSFTGNLTQDYGQPD